MIRRRDVDDDAEEEQQMMMLPTSTVTTSRQQPSLPANPPLQGEEGSMKPSYHNSYPSDQCDMGGILSW